MSYYLCVIKKALTSKKLRIIFQPRVKERGNSLFFIFGISLFFMVFLLVSLSILTTNDSRYFWISVGGAIFLILLSSGLLIALRRERRKYDEIAQRDQVTGTINYETYQEHVRQALNDTTDRRPRVYVHINLGRFRLINDLFGCEGGDQVLKDVARKLSEHLTEGELMSRIYADHFVLFLFAGSTQMDTSQRLQDMFSHLPKIPETPNGTVNMTVHCGVYSIDDSAMDVKVMNERANIACNEAMAEGCRVQFYDSQMLFTLLDEQLIEAGMEQALGDSQFVMYLQPIYDLKTHAIAGAEALVRWRHPVRGLLFPDQFIPTFERTGFIRKVDLYMFEHVCKMLRSWIDEDKPVVPVSVNLSRIHLDDIHLVPMLFSLIEFYGVPASLLELEITENSFREDEKVMLSLFHQLKKVGFSVAMDDFGTGFSTLNILKEIPLDTLKLDKRFLERSVDTARGRSVVTDVISMARHLNMKVVCEGIETENQLNFLSSVGSDLGQGYLFSRPIPTGDFEKLLAKENAASADADVILFR